MYYFKSKGILSTAISPSNAETNKCRATFRDFDKILTQNPSLSLDQKEPKGWNLFITRALSIHSSSLGS